MAAVNSAALWGAGAAEIDRLVALPVEAGISVGLKPSQVGANRRHIAVAVAVTAVDIFPTDEIGGCPLGHIALGGWIADLEQFGRRAGIAVVKAVEACEQAEQKQQPLQIQQT